MENKFGKFLPKKNQWLILLLVGVLLVVIAIPTKKKSDIPGKVQSDYEKVSATEMEKKLEHLLSQMEGVGQAHAMITYQEGTKVQGIVILAEGGKDAVVVRNITEVVQALFDVDSHKIKVIEKNQNN